ncbi:TetR/AcrR family transcriptional regulator C-terminal domain-containing protein [Streptomyces gardneri]|uniref:TetR/AcrR family transcriptional regulator n=1 Tax=Nocardia TaxID=1817 RepID=UPI00135CF36F|nr:MULTISPECIES: TetR/AcrR family transcriptional regulator [Nocardia]MBF6164568.1 TetR/AcrR family transcriptional regulator C-terminal domain-containing protein [Streptomyces gardneri]MBF6203907.1 TetR/AcrR family transcriptional regulator C-terminal domain-containing protein [Streptomyces gardneri]
MPAEKQPVGSVWTRPRRGREQPALTRKQIVAEAVALLDAEGMEALSMRQLGARLNAGATSLYRHVANRDELIELVVDEVYGEIDVPRIDDPARWRAAAQECATSLRAMILRHPWMASTLGQVGLSYLGPNVMRLNDRMVGLFEAGGFPAEEAGDGIGAVISYVVGIGITEAAYLSMLTRSGKTEKEWLAELRPAVEAAAREFPRVAQENWNQDPERLRERKFRYGLDRVLDGLDARRAT